MTAIREFPEHYDNPFTEEVTFKLERNPVDILKYLFQIRDKEARLLYYIMLNCNGSSMKYVDIADAADTLNYAERSIYGALAKLLEANIIARSEKQGVWYLHPAISSEFYHNRCLEIKL